MPTPDHPVALEEQIDRWRSYLRRRQAIHPVDIAELEDHLREQIAALTDAGLAADEAFLVAVKRMGDLDALSREFAREHSERLWKQLVVPSGAGEPKAAARTDAFVAFGLAVAAALAVKVPALFGLDLDEDGGFYARNLSLFVLPLLTGYFVWKRRLDTRTVAWLAAAFVAAAVFANVYPFTDGGHTEVLTALHLPIALWLVVGVAYAGGRWRQVAGRMDFIRFSGELFIYYVLIALGGGVLMGFMAMIFQAIGDRRRALLRVVAAAVRGGRRARGRRLAGGGQAERDREHGAGADAPLHAALRRRAAHVPGDPVVDRTRRRRRARRAHRLRSAPGGGAGPAALLDSRRATPVAAGAFDVVQVVLVISALVADAVALWAIAARISEFGFSPNRVAALSVNVILLVNLAWSAVLYLRFLRGRGSFASLERWQTDYLWVYAVWAAIVVIAFPPLFGFV